MAEEGEVESNGINQDGSSKLVKLQSKDHEEILNVIDQLRSEGISKYVNLPQLIVCGDQSSGKSSVLEAISGLSFPTKDNVCTRFATELILRRAPDSGVTASINPDDARTLAEQERLRNFKMPTLTLDRFGEIVEKAEEAIGVKKDGLPFSKDILRVEVYGPTQPHLTLVDLPGLYHAPDESQDEDGVQFVESLVLSYMNNRRSVMLAVISGKSDIALQKVTSFTRKLDPNGERTIGIITKPDTLPRGSDMEQSFYNLARNKRMPFRLGWHVLKNRSYEERHFTLAQRHESEVAFFVEGIWSSMPRNCVGIDSLRPRLSMVLKDHILSQMSGFIAETQSSLDDAETNLRRLGDPRQTLSQQRMYLLQGSERFSSLVSAAIDGTYTDPFFGDAMTDNGYRKRIRAVIQNRLTDFSDAVRREGEQRKVVSDDSDVEDKTASITRGDFIKEVQIRMRQSRGKELPGTYNPLIIGELFSVHARPWQGIVDKYMELVLGDIRRALMFVLQETLDTRSAEKLLEHVVNPHLLGVENELRTRVAELLEPHRSGHPITYNHYFIDTIKAAREQHYHASIAEKLKCFFGDKYPGSSNSQAYIFSMQGLIDTLGSQRSVDMEQFACSEAIDCMLAYYKVARKKFVDDFSTLGIERCLLKPLLALFNPRTVLQLSDNVIDDIANEDESTTLERDRLKGKVTILKNSLKHLQQLDLHGLTTMEPSPNILPNGTAENHSEVSISDVDDEKRTTTVEIIQEPEAPYLSDFEREEEIELAPEPQDPEVTDGWNFETPRSAKAKKSKKQAKNKWCD